MVEAGGAADRERGRRQDACRPVRDVEELGAEPVADIQRRRLQRDRARRPLRPIDRVDVRLAQPNVDVPGDFLERVGRARERRAGPGLLDIDLPGILLRPERLGVLREGRRELLAFFDELIGPCRGRPEPLLLERTEVLLDAPEELVRDRPGPIDAGTDRREPLRGEVTTGPPGQPDVPPVVPDPPEEVEHPVIACGPAEVIGRHALERVGLVEHDEVVSGEHARILSPGRELGRVEGVIDDQGVGGLHPRGPHRGNIRRGTDISSSGNRACRSRLPPKLPWTARNRGRPCSPPWSRHSTGRSRRARRDGPSSRTGPPHLGGRCSAGAG